MIDPGALLRARPHLRIVHHIPGRIRLRFAPSILDALPEIARADGRDLLASLGGIEDVRINAAAFSILVRYDQSRLQPALWEKLIDGSERDAEEVVSLLRQLSA